MEIQDRVELTHYYDIDELLHQAERAEQQLQRRNVTPPTSPWRRSHPESAGPSSKSSPSTCSNQVTPSEAPKSSLSKAASTHTTAGMECYTCGGRGHMRRDCPNNKRVMLTKDGYVTDEENLDESSSEKSVDDDHISVYPEDAAPGCRNIMV